MPRSLFSPHWKNRSPLCLASILLFPSLFLLLLILPNPNRSLPFSLHSNTLSLVSPPPFSESVDGVSINSRWSHPPHLSLLPPPPQEPPPFTAIEPVTGDIVNGSSVTDSLLALPPQPPPTISNIEPVPEPDQTTHLRTQPFQSPPQELLPAISEAEGVAGTKAAGIEENVRCNLYEGRWEKDEEGRYPLYAPGSCPFVDDAFTCQANGRPDEDYTKWRWKPNHCELPR